MNLTDEQYRAVYEYDRNLIVVAGAGSGKTRVLVERYLSLLDTHPDWPLSALVAITFTRKAAQEMRDRVRQALEDRLSHAADENELEMWAARLASMDSARIDTIHGLCASILRANAAEAGIDPGFVVLDEIEAGILLETVIEDTLQQALESDDARLFTEYERSQIEAVLRDFAAAPVPDLPDDLFTQWQSAWEQAAKTCVERLRTNADFQTAVTWEPLHGWPQDDRLYNDIWLSCFGCFDVLADTTRPVSDCLDALNYLANTIKVQVGSSAKWGGKEAYNEAKDTLRLIRSLAQAALASIGSPPGELEERAVTFLPLWARLIQRVQAAYRAAKREQSALDFDDLEICTRDLLVSRPVVRARYQREEFRHLLVDEFQDTNQAQWEIVQALADPHTPGCLFVVGDQKQSIYAFRGADVSVFGRVRQTLTAIGGERAEIPLARSFRSHQPLVDGFNAIFGRILTRDDASPVYAYETGLGQPMDAHRQSPPSASPALELLLVDTGAESIEPERRSADHNRRWEAYEIARRVREMVEIEQPVYDRELEAVRPVKYDDIALLFQSTSNITLYEDVFKAQDVPFVTVAGRGYYNRQEVWDLLNLLKALYNPADNLSLASVLRSPLFGLSDDALLSLRLITGDDGRPVLLWDALNQPGLVPDDEVPLALFARDCLYELAALAGRVTISELLREALNRTGYLATLTGLPDGARRRGNIEKLLSKAESSGKITLGAFEQYLSDLSAREVREGEALIEVSGTVTLMTVHASKGLEYPVVILVDASWERGNSGDSVVIGDSDYGLCCKVYDEDENKMEATFSYRMAMQLQQMRDEAERKRLLYVAATRAQDYLLVSGQVKQSKGVWAAKGWLGWLLAALEIDDLDDVSDECVDCGWGEVRVVCFRDMPPEDAFIVSDRARQSMWDQTFDAVPAQPPLLADVPLDRGAAARHLAVTQIADLGAIDIDSHAAERFRRHVFQDAPARISTVEYSRQQGRLTGEMVHEALRWWQPGAEAGSLDTLLRSYAWEQGIVDEAAQSQAIATARALLEQFYSSALYQEIAASGEVYRELPFIYNNGGRIIHGVIDILFQRDDGVWVIADYKTSHLGRGPTHETAHQHARRFYMQVGVYAVAVLEQLQVAETQLDVYIHYLRHNLTVPVKPEQWKSALRLMEPYIGRLAGS